MLCNFQACAIADINSKYLLFNDIQGAIVATIEVWLLCELQFLTSEMHASIPR